MFLAKHSSVTSSRKSEEAKAVLSEEESTQYFMSSKTVVTGMSITTSSHIASDESGPSVCDSFRE